MGPSKTPHLFFFSIILKPLDVYARIFTILFQSIELLLIPFDRFVAFVLARLALRLYSIPT